MSTERFFSDEGMEFATRCVLSGVRHGMAEVGEVLVATETIRDGDATSWVDTYVTLGRRLLGTAQRASAEGHRYSAWNSALRAANYLFAGLWWAPATSRAVDEPGLWDDHRAAWDLAVAHWPSHAEQVAVPSGGTTLPGVWFAPAHEGDLSGVTVVLLQGLHTPISDGCMTGLDGALARGARVLMIEGPGQGAALRRQGLLLGRDGTRVVDAAVEWLRARPEVDPSRIVVSGVNHGAYLALSGVLRSGLVPGGAGIAALVLDPGALDLGGAARDAVRDAGDDPAQLALLEGTTTGPTGAASLQAALALLDSCRIDPEELAGLCVPVLVVEAEDATTFAEQSATLVAALGERAHVVRLRHAEGAGADCGLDASQIHDAAVADLLPELLGTASPYPAEPTDGSPRFPRPTPVHEHGAIR